MSWNLEQIYQYWGFNSFFVTKLNQIIYHRKKNQVVVLSILWVIYLLFATVRSESGVCVVMMKPPLFFFSPTYFFPQNKIGVWRLLTLSYKRRTSRITVHLDTEVQNKELTLRVRMRAFRKISTILIIFVHNIELQMCFDRAQINGLN